MFEQGGRPYNDLVNCFEHIAENIPYIDTNNAVALGASYGGFMISEDRYFHLTLLPFIP